MCVLVSNCAGTEVKGTQGVQDTGERHMDILFVGVFVSAYVRQLDRGKRQERLYINILGRERKR